MELTANNLQFNDITIGDTYEFSREITTADIEKFIELTGDKNPLHTDADFAAKTKFGQPIVHGMLLGSLFSTLVGMYCPGKRALYLLQTLQFKKPLISGKTVKVRGVITAKSDSTKIITLKTEILEGSEILVLGEAKVQLLEI